MSSDMERFRELMTGSNPKEREIVTHLKSVFGDDHGRMVLFYLAETSRIVREENRARVVLAFLAGVGVMALVGIVARLFS